MNLVKTEKEQETMKKGGKILADVLWEVMSYIKPGVSELELDSLAERLIREKGGEPGFQKVKGYRHTICACVNDVVVHGVPSAYKLKEGDMICIDCGVFLAGFHTDMAETILVSTQNSENEKFLEVGKKALEEGIKAAIAGNRIGHISKTIQDIVEKQHGYSIVRSLVGHGVGRSLHEPPEVPGYLAGKIEQTPLLEAGMTIAIEVIYVMGKKDVVYAGNDDWTIKTTDGSLSAVFERSILITNGIPILLTP